ncbi:MFS transporter [Novosphingobium profundi]|uniref:MFS transporter n=1 Tax=Novosphingobium profundi TaxID=1774954 RepID=UPI001BDA38CA|nr:MFS transporter [Novosphingobium profundi]MBT0666753.1 MFS transporter [Novosphingobium profundi]
MPRRSMVIAALSTMVEWYDFTLYLYFATVLARVFFAADGHSMTQTLGGFAIAYLLRPIGALVFGHLGDRFGRRVSMLGSMALMTAAMLATAVLPTYAQAGPVAGVLLVLLRCVMSFSVGGEYTGVVAYLLEGAHAHRRGLVASCASASSEIGALLAAGAAALTVWIMPSDALVEWGWRIPFLFGGALAACVLFARAALSETPEFHAQKRSGTVPDRPIRHILSGHRAAIARGFAISALGSITYYVGITYVPAFLDATGTMPETQALSISTLAALTVILVTPLTGMLSDRIGRRPVLVALALVAIVVPSALFAGMTANGPATWAGALVMAALGGAVSAVGAVTTAELFPGEGRLSGLALGATSATAIFGGLTPVIAHLLVTGTGWAGAPGAMISAVALCAIAVFVGIPETAPARQAR